MAEEKSTPYRVLARKYRSRNFDELIGQDALVRTLKNAIQSGRIAHAFMLTGIRGTGKTSTARIIAKALNYAGPDGAAAPTTGPTDDCPICQAITEDRHPDVLEMDAASRTGVDDIREILDGVRYAPTSARYKVYIIDEVHMLSKQAFNALLKTLEEPPPHVIFIFATTEIRKVPVTVLSRCQRFDLRRVDIPTLAAHYRRICELENVSIDDDALTLIARAADGSVRDGLSLLDQAIALAGGAITAVQVQDMLGLSDRAAVLDVLDHAINGRCDAALARVETMYEKGGDPAVILNDMLDFTHMLTRLRAVPAMRTAPGALAKETLDRLTSMAGELSMPTLGRAWQILLKGTAELQHAPNPQAAAEMIVIRLAYAADLPDPGELLRRLGREGGGDDGGSRATAAGSGAVAAVSASSSGSSFSGGASSLAVAEAAPMSSPAPASQGVPLPQSLEEIEALLRAGGHVVLASELYHHVHLVRLEPGMLEIRLGAGARGDLYNDLGRALRDLTGRRWMVGVSRDEGLPTLAAQAARSQEAKAAAAAAHPVVGEIMRAFPGARLSVRTNN